MATEKSDRYYLVREDMLSEAMQKTLEAKELLERGKAKTVFEAVNAVDLSRSAFYKYRDGIFPFHTMVKEKIITLSINLEDRSGNLSRLLSIIASAQANVLTINQTIPLQGRANITISIETASINIDIDELVKKLEKMEGVERVDLVGSGF
ncbi:ACT domain-containing protein [Anaerobacillus sp. MEB173]|uniref:ACT domain-containing protein n=1 Tax=Anaerobacillus sp. MEB173 TaxID=3383345 RepID=UPI003F93802E